MKLNEFIKCAKKFSKDTQKWYSLDDLTFYTTDSIEFWKETYDNAHGGLDLEWAFHLNDDEIEKEAQKEFRDQFVQETENLINDDDLTINEILRILVIKYN